MKYFYLFLAVLFGLFSYWQHNDPDAVLWVLLYGLIAVMHLLAFRGIMIKWGTAFAALSCLVWMMTLLPGFMSWVDGGMPSIASEMAADEPHIEIVREFLGLLIATLALVHLSIQAFRNGG